MRRAVAVLVVPVLVLAGFLVAAPAAQAQHPGANGLITSIEGGVWSGGVRPDGTFRSCCDPFPDDANPAKPLIAPEQAVWGPDGVSVAVVGDWSNDPKVTGLEILVYDSVADTVRSLGAADDSRPDFSPDGSQLVITRLGDLVVLDVATGAVVRTLTSTPAVAETRAGAPTARPSRSRRPQASRSCPPAAAPAPWCRPAPRARSTPPTASTWPTSSGSS